MWYQHQQGRAVRITPNLIKIRPVEASEQAPRSLNEGISSGQTHGL
jgi:hypothetical protein